MANVQLYLTDILRYKLYKISTCYSYVIINIHVMYKLRFCTSCNLYKQFVQVATRTKLAVQVATCTEFHYQKNPTWTILFYTLALKRILVKLTILLNIYILLYVYKYPN